MTEFTITTAASDEFNVYLAGRDVAMPLRLDPENVGVILDDDGREFLTIDSVAERDDDDVTAITQLVAASLNKIGGFPHG